jgi:uncharacterized protein DUF6062
MSDAGDRPDLLEAEVAACIGGDRCPVCVLAEETERAAVSWMVTTNIREAATIQRVAAARGFCRRHWDALLDRSGGDLGVAGARIASAIARTESDLVIDDLQPPACPICASVSRRERSVVAILVAALDDPANARRFRSSPGLCRPHLRIGVAEAGNRPSTRAMIDTYREIRRAFARHVEEASVDPEARSRVLRRFIASLVGGR